MHWFDLGVYRYYFIKLQALPLTIRYILQLLLEPHLSSELLKINYFFPNSFHTALISSDS